jgi:hypothetical protein
LDTRPARTPAEPKKEEYVSLNKVGVGAAIVAASAAIVVGGSALANAAARTSAVAGTAGYGAAGYGAPGNGGPGEGGPGGHGGGRGGSADTQVTGDELTKVKDAVKAEDAGVTVTDVRKDPDGSYDVYGTKAGAQVAYDVSADLKTFTARTGGPGGRGQGQSQGQGPAAPGSNA